MWSGGSGDGEEDVDLAGVDLLLQGVVEVDGGLGRSRRRGAPGGPVSTSGALGGEELQVGRCRPAAPRGGGGGQMTASGARRRVGTVAAWGDVGGRRGAARIERGRGAARRSDDLGIEKGPAGKKARAGPTRQYRRRTTSTYASDAFLPEAYNTPVRLQY
jgi:hypothetical protein